MQYGQYVRATWPNIRLEKEFALISFIILLSKGKKRRILLFRHCNIYIVSIHHHWSTNPLSKRYCYRSGGLVNILSSQIAIRTKNFFRTFFPQFNQCCSSTSPHRVQTEKISLHEFQLGVKTFFAEEQFSNLHSCVCGNFQNSSKGQRRPLLLVQEKVFCGRI